MQGLGIGVLVLVLFVLFLSAAGKWTRYFREKDAVDKRNVVEGVHTDIRLMGKAFHCGSVVAIDAGHQVDLPINFYDNTNGKLIMECGFFARGEPGSKRGEACPPPEWTCGTNFP
jgi:hypothetical protein